MSNVPEVAAAGCENSPKTALTEVQLSAFWDWIVANADAARRMARKFVPTRDIDDVVNSASILFLESFERAENPARMPADDDEFRRRYLAIVRNHALDCVRAPGGTEAAVHAHWGIAPEPVVGGRKTADRPLDQVFARNDLDHYDAPAPAEVRPRDNVDELGRILRRQADNLSRMQRIVVLETFFEGRKRAEVAARNGISVKTYDNHLQAAFARLRDELWEEAFCDDDVDRSVWSDRIEGLSDRYDDALGRRMAEQFARIADFLRTHFPSEGEAGTNSSAGAA
jgi:DNA-directed RNA polymerase specialized sigma24 family protein